MRATNVFHFFCSLLLILPLLTVAPSAFAADKAEKPIVMTLPVPQITGGMPLMDALARRHANRDFDQSVAISLQELSNLLWATWGINRPDGRRTAPTAKNRQQLEVYLAMPSGVWRYDASAGSLVLITNQDVRNKLENAPLTLLYAAPAEDPFGAMHIGALYQNAGLYCASRGLANVVKQSGRDALDGILPLPKGYKIYIIQAIGWPKTSK